MSIEEIAKQIYPDVDGYLDQIEHDRIQFIRGYNYAKENITSGSYNANSDYWQHGAATQLNVTHWMPLPDAPISTTED